MIDVLEKFIDSLPTHPSESVYTTPFDLLFADVWGPTPMVSVGGNKYLLTGVDAYTRYTWVFL